MGDGTMVRPRRASARLGRGVAITGVAWIPEGAPLPLEQWLDCGRRLGALGRGVAWWLGDWLLYGNMRYGEKYARAARVTGYDPQSLMNMSYVASCFNPSRRREQLSWSHHAELAALEPDQQDRWLDFAQTQRLSVHSLRLEVRAWRRSEPERSVAARHAPAHDLREASRRVVCPECQHVIDTLA